MGRGRQGQEAGPGSSTKRGLDQTKTRAVEVKDFVVYMMALYAKAGVVVLLLLLLWLWLWLWLQLEKTDRDEYTTVPVR